MKQPLSFSPIFNELSESEIRDLQAAVASVEKFVKNSPEISNVGYATRDAHSKTYAMASGILETSEEAPDFVRQIFDRKTYDILARVSTASPVVSKHGRDIPAYGFSLKIKDIQGSDANFPLVNFPLFPTNDVSDFLRFFTALNTFLVTKADNFVVSALDLPLLFTRSLPLMRGLASADLIKETIRFIRRRKDFFFSRNFDSIGCYRMGNYMVKLGLRPQDIPRNYGRNEPQSRSVPLFLHSHGATFDLVVQVCENLENQPINELTKRWRKAPEYKIGTVTLPHQVADHSDLNLENLNFNPFENPEILLPVGKLQRVRKEIYSASITTRNSINKIL